MDKLLKVKVGEYVDIHVTGGYHYSGQVTEVYDEMFILGDYTIYFNEVENINGKAVNNHVAEIEAEDSDKKMAKTTSKFAISICSILVIINIIILIMSNNRFNALSSGIAAITLIVLVIINVHLLKRGDR